jgi:hypothetical protein
LAAGEYGSDAGGRKLAVNRWKCYDDLFSDFVNGVRDEISLVAGRLESNRDPVPAQVVARAIERVVTDEIQRP